MCSALQAFINSESLRSGKSERPTVRRVRVSGVSIASPVLASRIAPSQTPFVVVSYMYKHIRAIAGG